MLTTTILLASLIQDIPAGRNVDCATSTPIAQPIMGHRGSGKSDPDTPFAENTIASFENAFYDGADYVELDTQLSKDGKVVIMHDFRVDKTTNLTGCVAAFNYAELATADATKGSGATNKVGAPLLREVLSLARARGKYVNIEIKVNAGDETACPDTDIPSLVDAVVAEVKAEDMAEQVMFSSFSLEAAKRAKAKLPGARSGLLTADGGDALLAQANAAKGANLDAINPLFAALTPNHDLLAPLHDTGLDVIPWTVNGEAAIEDFAFSWSGCTHHRRGSHCGAQTQCVASTRRLPNATRGFARRLRLRLGWRTKPLLASRVARGAGRRAPTPPLDGRLTIDRRPLDKKRATGINRSPFSFLVK